MKIAHEIEGIKFIVYNNPIEFTSDFFIIPEDAVLNDYIPTSSGFACIPDNEIAIFKRDDCSFDDLLSTIAHELGHLIEGGFKKNPPDKDRYWKRHEQKAEHYENFTMKAYRITKIIIDFK